MDLTELQSQYDQISPFFSFLWAIEDIRHVEPPLTVAPSINSNLFRNGKIKIKSILDSNNKFVLENDLKNSLKGLSFIVLYNLIEGTINEILNDAFKHVNASATNYNRASKKFKEVWLRFQYKTFENASGQSIVDCLKVLPKETLNFTHTNSEGITTHGYSAYLAKIGKSAEISGNLDIRKIRLLFQKYEIPIPTFKLDANKILIIKNNRNFVAHGEKKLSEVGKNYSIRELYEFKETTFALLSQCVKSSIQFQKQRPFRKLSSR